MPITGSHALRAPSLRLPGRDLPASCLIQPLRPPGFCNPACLLLQLHLLPCIGVACYLCVPPSSTGSLYAQFIHSLNKCTEHLPRARPCPRPSGYASEQTDPNCPSSWNLHSSMEGKPVINESVTS